MHHIRTGSLSVLFTCPLPNCLVRGRICSQSEHLNRVRLLALLLRGPRVLLGCSRLLVACVMAPSTANGGCGGDGSGSMRGTAPVNKLEGENAKAAAEVEASLQRRLCAETVDQLLVAMKDLRSVLIPSAQNGEPRQPSLTPHQKEGGIEGLNEAEKMILAACLPPVLRWAAAPSRHALAGSQKGRGDAFPSYRSAAQNFSWAFAGTQILADEGAPRKAALYILATIQVSEDAGTGSSGQPEKRTFAAESWTSLEKCVGIAVPCQLDPIQLPIAGLDSGLTSVVCSECTRVAKMSRHLWGCCRCHRWVGSSTSSRSGAPSGQSVLLCFCNRPESSDFLNISSLNQLHCSVSCVPLCYSLQLF